MEELKSGRELDVLVAEKVMEWKRLTYSQTGESRINENELTNFWHSKDLEEQELAEDFLDFEYGRDIDAWSPSTKIAAAWKVLRHLNSRGWLPKIMSDYNLLDDKVAWRCSLALPYVREIYVNFKTIEEAPHAICLAALKAVEK